MTAELLISSDLVVAYRSHSKRFAWQLPAALCCAVGITFLLAGCQSGGQYDQAARELRMQEDQLYAMEDYVAQYQQLICKYRAENAALRRQLAQQGRTPTRGPGTRNGVPPTTEGPDIEIPETPATNGSPAEPVEPPDVPPLGETTSVELHEIQERRVNDVLLRGEVIENDEGGGARLAIEVEPRDATGATTNFDGAISLMLVEANGDEGSEKLARWDYQPQDVQAALDSSGGERIRFHVELPSDAPVPDASELWVQLLPKEGGRLVAHADIDLQQPGAFASQSAEPAIRDAIEDHEVMTAVYQEASEVPPVESEVLDAGWTVALPGQPAGIAPESDREEWRASLEPPPEAIATARPELNTSRPSNTQREKRTVASRRRRAAWSPDRSDRSSGASKTAARPAWSATR